MNLSLFLRDLLERAVTTYLEAFLGFVLLAPMLDVSVLTAAGVAALPALFSVVKAGILEFLKVRPPAGFLLDLIERTVATYLVTFLGLVAVNPGDVAVYRLALVSALPAALAVLKAGIASRVADTVTPASLAPTPSSAP